MKPSCPRKCIFSKKTVVIMFLFSNHALSKEEYYEKSSFEDGTDGWDLKNWKRMKLDEVKKLHPSFPQPDDLNDKVSSIFITICLLNCAMCFYFAMVGARPLKCHWFCYLLIRKDKTGPNKGSKANVLTVPPFFLVYYRVKTKFLLTVTDTSIFK